jgi:membrane protein DedA with SNARE-associated domain
MKQVGFFFARLLPVVRHLISIPAGIVRMNFAVFSVMTIVRSAIWCYILAHLGEKAYRVEPQLLTDPEALVRFIHGQSTWILVVAGNLCGTLHIVDAPVQTATDAFERPANVLIN